MSNSGNDYRVSRPGRDVECTGRRFITQVSPVEERAGPVEIALVGTRYYHETAITGIHVGEIGENDEVIAVDAAVTAFVACALPAEVFPGAVERTRVDYTARLVHEHGAPDKPGFPGGEFLHDGPVARLEYQPFQRFVKGESVIVHTVVPAPEIRWQVFYRRLDISFRGFAGLGEFLFPNGSFQVQIAGQVEQVSLLFGHHD